MNADTLEHADMSEDLTRDARTPALLAPFEIVGRATLTGFGYAGAVMLLLLDAGRRSLWPFGRDNGVEGGFTRVVFHQMAWMLAMGMPLVGMVHVAMGSFLSLQAYYGSTFVDGTGAVVGVGLLRNLGGLMAGLTFAGLLAARVIPELKAVASPLSAGNPDFDPGALAAPRIQAAAVACVLLSLWGVAVGTVVGWQASQSMMGLSTETYFLMMGRMMWYRDIIGLVCKCLVFGSVSAAICCHEGLARGRDDASDAERGPSGRGASHGTLASPLPLTTPVFRAACLSLAAVLVLNSSWFILVYHAVPFYGPTLLPPPGP